MKVKSILHSNERLNLCSNVGIPGCRLCSEWSERELVLTSAARIDQIQPTAMRETLVTAQICPLNLYFSFIDDESLLIRNKSFNQPT